MKIAFPMKTHLIFGRSRFPQVEVLVTEQDERWTVSLNSRKRSRCSKGSLATPLGSRGAKRVRGLASAPGALFVTGIKTSSVVTALVAVAASHTAAAATAITAIVAITSFAATTVPANAKIVFTVRVTAAARVLRTSRAGVTTAAAAAVTAAVTANCRSRSSPGSFSQLPGNFRLAGGFSLISSTPGGLGC
jgi:hypothetical protein